MRLLNKFIFSVIFFLSFFATQTSSIFAIPKFSTTYQTNYTVYNDGTTHVKYNIAQKNNFTAIYATEFSLSVNQTKITNVKVTDETTSMIPDVTKTTNQTTITFPFVNKIVGLNKIHHFFVEYDSKDIATKVGNTWQVNIPKLEPDENLTDQMIILNLPNGFPSPAYVDPKPNVVVGNTYYFSGNTLANKPISAVFGQNQFFEVKLDYHLDNQENKTIEKTIPIPPDTNYQSVLIKSLNPKPESIKTDNDGNWIAHYKIPAHQKLDIRGEFIIRLSFTPKNKSEISIAEYTSKNDVWNYDDPIFSSSDLVNLNTPKLIYDFVSDKLNYNYQKVTRSSANQTKASDSLKNYQDAICTDFTAVFIALARKSGIAAREIQGYAISENSDLKPLSLTRDILHAWPEYYDTEKKSWIQIDPTWANTTHGLDYFNKTDMNHLTFVIHGMSPTSPIAPGGYKIGNNLEKDIEVTPIAETIFPDPKLNLVDTKTKGDSFIVSLENSSAVTFSGDVFIENNEFIDEKIKNTIIIPQSSREIIFPLKKRPFISDKTVEVIIYANGQKFSQKTSINAIIGAPFLAAGGLIFLGVITLVAWYLSLRRR